MNPGILSSLSRQNGCRGAAASPKAVRPCTGQDTLPFRHLLTRFARLTRTAVYSLVLLPAVQGIAADSNYLRGNFTGAEMLKYCKAANDDSVRDFERGVCTGFIDGFAAGHHAAELWHAFHHRDENIDDIFGHLCVPTDTNRTALVTLFVRYLENHPDNLSWNAGLLLESALREAFPCKKDN